MANSTTPSVRTTQTSQRESVSGHAFRASACPTEIRITPLTDQQTAESSRLPDIDGSSMVLSGSNISEEICPSRIDEDFSNFVSTERNASFESSSSGEVVGLNDDNMFSVPGSDENTPDDPSSPLNELFKLCANLVNDSDKWERNISFPPDPSKSFPIEAAVQRVLSRTSQLSEILKAMAVAESIPPHQHFGNLSPTQILPCFPDVDSVLSSNYNPTEQSLGLEGSRRSNNSRYPVNIPYSQASKPTQATTGCKIHDISITTTLVTAYILTVQAWRRVFLEIHHFQQASKQDRSRRFPKLPRLQLGGYSVQNNSEIQIMVLLQLSSSMLQLVETYLGFPNATTCNGPGDDVQVKRLVLTTDPVSVSLRETMLSQERLRISKECGFGELSLTMMMDEIRKQLARRG